MRGDLSAGVGARPADAAAVRASAGKEDSPIAAALVFDNSLRMTYLHENQTRLEEARELALWLLEQLPTDAPVTVIDRASRYGGRETDKSRGRAATSSGSTPAPSSGRSKMPCATRSIGSSCRPTTAARFTCSPIWRPSIGRIEALADFQARLDELPGTSVYVIDVGVERPHNLALGALRLSSQELAPGSLLQIDTELTSTELTATGALRPASSASPPELTIELDTVEEGGATQRRGQQVVRTDADAAAAGRILPLGPPAGYAPRFLADRRRRPAPCGRRPLLHG